MLDIFLYAANAVLPIIILITFGYILKKKSIIGSSFMKDGNKLIFRYLIPALIVYNIYNIPNISSIQWDIVIFSVSVILLIFLLGLITVHFFVKDGKSKGVVLQCTFRSNYAIIGIPLTEALGGSEAASVTAIILAFTIPLFNVLAVFSLSMFSSDDEQKRSFKQMLAEIAKNPLILASAAGLLILAIRSILPLNANGEIVFSISRDLSFIYETIASLAKATTALSLIVLGGLLDFSTLKGNLKNIFIGTFWRVILAPVIGLTLAVYLDKVGIIDCGNTEFASLIALFGAPVAVSSAIMAGEMNSDAPLARQLVVWTSICPIVTIYTIIVIMKYLGFI